MNIEIEDIDALAYDHDLVLFDRINNNRRNTVYRPSQKELNSGGQCIEVMLVKRMIGRRTEESMIVWVRSLSPGHELEKHVLSGGDLGSLREIMLEVYQHNENLLNKKRVDFEVC